MGESRETMIFCVGYLCNIVAWMCMSTARATIGRPETDRQTDRQYCRSVYRRQKYACDSSSRMLTNGRSEQKEALQEVVEERGSSA